MDRGALPCVASLPTLLVPSDAVGNGVEHAGNLASQVSYLVTGAKVPSPAVDSALFGRRAYLTASVLIASTSTLSFLTKATANQAPLHYQLTSFCSGLALYLRAISISVLTNLQLGALGLIVAAR